MSEIKHVKGLGFDATIMDRDEHADFPCDFHKLGEEIAPMPCPEEPFVFVSLTGIEEGLSMCRKHYARFVFDLMETLDVFDLSETDMPPKEEDGVIMKEDSAVTMSGFYELFMRIKREKSGAN